MSNMGASIIFDAIRMACRARHGMLRDRPMKKALLFIAALALLAPPFAGAQQWVAPFGPLAQAQGPMKKGEQGGGRGGGREGRPPPHDGRHQGRMTDEERRGLQQDLDRANREIYRPAPRR